MHVVAINGSPRKNGNTHTLLAKTLEPLAEAGWTTELVQLGGKKIRGCRACFKCMETKDRRCAFTDDLFNEVMAKMLVADAMILGSPTYFTDVSAELKALIDRSGFVAFANDGAFRGKIGAAVVAVRRGGGTHVFDTINHMYLMSGMLLPGSTYWNLGFGLNEGEVLGDAEGLRNMRHLGQMIAWLGRAVQPAMKDYPHPAPMAAPEG